MKPLNTKNNGCVPMSSNCIKWQGPDIDFLELCNDSSVTEVIYQLAEKTNEIMSMFDIEELDLACLESKCGPNDLHELLQEMIYKLCSLSPETPSEYKSQKISVPPCLMDKFPDGNGGYLKEIPIENMVGYLASWYCSIDKVVSGLKDEIDDIKDNLTVVNNNIEKLDLNKQDKISVDGKCFGGTITPEELLNKLAESLCGYKAVLGKPEDISKSVSKQCSNLENTRTFTDPQKKYSDIEGWSKNPSTVSDTLANIWITLCDIRTKVASIEAEIPIGGIVISDAWRSCDGKVWMSLVTSDNVTWNDTASLKVSDGTNDVTIPISDLNAKLNTTSQVSFTGAESFAKDDQLAITLTASYKKPLDDNYTSATYNGNVFPLVSNLTLTLDGSDVVISFNNLNKRNITISRGITGGSLSTLTTLDSDVNTYTDTTAQPGTSYTYALYDDISECIEAEITTTPVECTTIETDASSTLTEGDNVNNVGADEYNDFIERYNNDKNSSN